MKQLSSYWPLFMQELLEFQVLAESEQPELEMAWQKALQTPKDLFLFSLTDYGVRRWEGMLGIPLDSTLNLEQRRARVINRLMRFPPFTLRYLQHLMDQLAGRPGRVVLALNDWILTASVAIEDAFLLREARQTLLELKPAAVVLLERRTATAESSLHMGGYAQIYRLRNGGVSA